jgi:hypothetical protein
MLDQRSVSYYSSTTKHASRTAKILMPTAPSYMVESAAKINMEAKKRAGVNSVHKSPASPYHEYFEKPQGTKISFFGLEENNDHYGL